MQTNGFWAAGFNAILLPPFLLAASAWYSRPWLVFGTVLVFFPLARLLFGAYQPGETNTLPPRWTWLLDQLPRAYGLALGTALMFLLWVWKTGSLPAADIVPWTLSLWMTLVFASCVAHALLHRRTSTDRILGHVLAGVAGYPVLAYEHLRHHRLTGRTAAAEAPAVEESMWVFSYRRLRRIGMEALGSQGIAWWGDFRSPTVRGLRIALASTTATMVLFGLAAGWLGVLTYAAAAGLVAFSMQLVTYMQHWGLGDDHLSDAHGRGLAWEDDCRFQAWITLSLSLHQSHHDEAATPYHQLGLAGRAPRLPAGYVLLMFAAMVPPIWRRVMRPALDYWLAHPGTPPTAGRKVACVVVYRPAHGGTPGEPAKSV